MATKELIITEKGTCDRTYRYPVRITGGSVGYAAKPPSTSPFVYDIADLFKFETVVPTRPAFAGRQGHQGFSRVNGSRRMPGRVPPYKAARAHHPDHRGGSPSRGRAASAAGRGRAAARL